MDDASRMPSDLELPKLEDIHFPTSAREDYEATVEMLALWTDAFKLAGPAAQVAELERARKNFEIYIREATDDARGLSRAEGRSNGVFVIRLLTYLDDYLTVSQLDELFEVLTGSWEELDQETRREAISFLCDALYELQGHGNASAQALIFNFLSNLITAERSPIVVHALRGLLVHASGLRPEDLATLASNLQSDEWLAVIKRHSAKHPSLARLRTELLSQYRALAAFEESEFPQASPLGLPPIVSILSRKGGVGKTSLALALALRYARTKKVALLDLDIVGPSLAYYFAFDQQSTIQTLEDVLSGVVPLADAQDRLFNAPMNKLPRVSDPSNLMVAQSSSLGAPRYELYERIFSGRLERVRANMQALLQSLEGKADLVIIDNAPGLLGLGLLSFNFAYSGGGLTLFVTSADIQDVGALQIEMDLFRGVIATAADVTPFRWVCNKVPASSKHIYENTQLLQYYLRKHPALGDAPDFLEERIIRRYSAPFPTPIVITAIEPMATTFAVNEKTGATIDFNKLLAPLEAAESGFGDICEVVDKMLERRSA